MTHTLSLRWLKLPNGKRILQEYVWDGMSDKMGWFDIPDFPYHKLTQEEVDARELWKDEQVRTERVKSVEARREGSVITEEEAKARDQTRPGDSG